MYICTLAPNDDETHSTISALQGSIRLDLDPSTSTVTHHAISKISSVSTTSHPHHYLRTPCNALVGEKRILSALSSICGGIR